MPPQSQSQSQSQSAAAAAAATPRTNLLIPSKRHLLTPSSKKILNPSSRPAYISIKPHEPTSPSSSKESTTERNRPVTVEVDLSGAPQPFLDPVAWLNMKAVAEGEGRVAEGLEEQERREREREAGREFGGMAVRSRRDVRRRGIGRDR